MFSVPKRIKDALDRTLAEEQARHKAFNERQAASSNTHNTKTFSTQDIDKQPALAGLPSPHPTVFETIFKLEDDPPSRSSTPKHASSGTDAKGGTDQPDSGKNDSSDGHNASTDKAEGADTSEKPDGPALPPGVQSRLRKLEKLEATYPGK
ncbi:hypothetical protein GGR51DRAFT_66942 [Nemania sp. FL0031]|nr:hypothetical protein GGR51DRAFT_66942 [Nemania sp. FL0031]